jgi:hypothetical protein
VSDIVDTVILQNELAYADVLPVAFHAHREPPDSALQAAWGERTLRTLQAATALEDQGSHEKVDEDSPAGPHIQRIDLKINLLLDLVGHLLATSQRRPPAVGVRFNARGIVWQPTADAQPLRAGMRGHIEIFLRDCLIQPLTFQGVIADAEAGGPTHLHFDALPELVSGLVEKLVFRRHRRQVAGVRLTRKG